jgi:hypothetical protein
MTQLTAEEIKTFIDEGGEIDCGDDDEKKQLVLRVLEELGYTIGVPKDEAYEYRYVYYSTIFPEIHMGMVQDRDHVISADDVLIPGASPENNDTNIDKSKLYDWAEFFLATE